MVISTSQVLALDGTGQLYAGRANLIAPPDPYLFLAAAKTTNLELYAAQPIQHRNKGMDGVPSIRVGQHGRVTLAGYTVTPDNQPITPSTVRRVHAAVFCPDLTGGTPLGQWWPAVADVVFSTKQYALNPKGYNWAVEFDMTTSPQTEGGNDYLVEVVFEMTNGNKIPEQGRVQVRPTYLLPINEY